MILPQDSDVAPVHLSDFLERVKKTLGHDLRTPLGTIANYAAVLEEVLKREADDVRGMARCIRANAINVATMLEQTLAATLLAARPPAPARFDAAILLGEVAKALAQEMRILGDGKPDADGADPFDPALVAFVWKLFVEFVRRESPAVANRAWVARRDADGRASLVLGMGRADDGTAAVSLADLLSHEPSADATARSFGLKLCVELVHVRGGDLEVAGRAGGDVALRLSFPSKCVIELCNRM